MLLLTRFFPRLFDTLRNPTTCYVGRVLEADVKAGGVFDVTARNVIRVHFPRPSERKRIVRHGWRQRLSTPAGRRIIMNRILKGRHVLSH